MSYSAPASIRRALVAPAVALALLAPVARAGAQTDYYNTDAGRPIRVEDAYPVEYRAVEFQIAPLRLERARGGVYSWGIEPEIAVGAIPRLQLEAGFPLEYTDLGAGGHSAGLAGVALSGLVNLNAETRLPAFAIGGGYLVPVGPLAPDRGYTTVKGIATKTFTLARVHLNGEYAVGRRPAREGGPHELSRWMGGVAVDHTFPLESMLVTAEVVARQPLASAEAVQWDAAAGTRYQLSPRVAADAGAGYRLTGEKGWFVTFGAAVALGLPWKGR